MPEKTERTVVKAVENATKYSDGSILIKNVRFSYPHGIEPQKGGVDKKTGKPYDPSYSIVGLLHKKTHREATNLLKAEIESILAEKNKGAGIKADNWFLRDGNQSGKDDYKGYFTVSARESVKHKPDIRNAKRIKMLDPALEKAPSKAEEDGYVLYGGGYGNLLIRPWWMNNEYGRRVNANFLALQVIPSNGRPAEAFGEDSRPSEDDIDNTFDDESSDSDWTDDTEELDTSGL